MSGRKEEIKLVKGREKYRVVHVIGCDRQQSKHLIIEKVFTSMSVGKRNKEEMSKLLTTSSRNTDGVSQPHLCFHLCVLSPWPMCA